MNTTITPTNAGVQELYSPSLEEILRFNPFKYHGGRCCKWLETHLNPDGTTGTHWNKYEDECEKHIWWRLASYAAELPRAWYKVCADEQDRAIRDAANKQFPRSYRKPVAEIDFLDPYSEAPITIYPQMDNSWKVSNGGRSHYFFACPVEGTMRLEGEMYIDVLKMLCRLWVTVPRKKGERRISPLVARSQKGSNVKNVVTLEVINVKGAVRVDQWGGAIVYHPS